VEKEKFIIDLDLKKGIKDIYYNKLEAHCDG